MSNTHLKIIMSYGSKKMNNPLVQKRGLFISSSKSKTVAPAAAHIRLSDRSRATLIIRTTVYESPSESFWDLSTVVRTPTSISIEAFHLRKDPNWEYIYQVIQRTSSLPTSMRIPAIFLLCV